MLTPQSRIAIVGGGPAGLTLGLLLHKQNIPFTIFELRPKPSDEEFSQPSGSLDLHEHSGIAALKACGLFEQAMALTGDCTQEQKIADKSGNIIYEDAVGDDRPEIYRHDLTKLLTSHLPTASIQWSHKLIDAKRVTTSGTSAIELDFGIHGKHAFDLVVGADGAWSRVRALLTDVKPHYVGIHNITMTIRQMTTKYPELLALVGHGTFFSLADKHGVFAQRASQDSARMYIMLSTEDKDYTSTSGLAGKTPVQAKDLLVGDGAMLNPWGEIIKQLIAVACEDESAHNGGANLDIKPFYTLPAGHSWDHQANATLIGDAAHLMNPPAGEGVNIAMRDALLLSEAIIKAYKAESLDNDTFQHVLDTGIKDFEVDMAARAVEMAEGTREVSEVMFGTDDGAMAMANWFRTMFEVAA